MTPRMKASVEVAGASGGERAIFVVNDGEVIVISDDEGGNEGNEQEIDVEEQRSVFPNDDKDDSSPAQQAPRVALPGRTVLTSKAEFSSSFQFL